MATIIIVPGTWSWDGEFPKQDADTFWGEKSSAFRNALEAAGHTAYLYVWSTTVGGIGLGSRDLLVWRAAGVNLLDFVTARGISSSTPLTILSHSHGLQVTIAAASYGLHITHLIDISGPYRRDMQDFIDTARPHIDQWTHFHGDWYRDRMAGFGGWFDSWNPTTWFRNPRNHPAADINIHLKGANHTPLKDPQFFPSILKVIHD